MIENTILAFACLILLIVGVVGVLGGYEVRETDDFMRKNQRK